MKRFLSLLLPAFVAISVSGQQQGTGFPPFGSLQNGQFDHVNLQNLNVNFSIPIEASPGRGLNHSFALTFNSFAWQIGGGGFPDNRWVPAISGATGQFLGYSAFGLFAAGYPRFGDLFYSEEVVTCVIDSVNSNHIFNFGFVEPNGTTHTFTVDFYDTPTACNYPSGLIAYADDGTGLFLNTAWPFTVYDKNGVIRYTDSSNNRPFDTNGNYLPAQGLNNSYPDTLNRVPLKFFTYSDHYEYQTLDVNGNYQTTKLMFGTFNVRTNFLCPGGVEFNNTGASLPTSLLLPNGQSYSFTYEDTPGSPGYVTGRLKRVTLPTGGFYEYRYPTSGNGGIKCDDATITDLTRIVNDGSNSYTWTYSRTQTENTDTRKTWKTLVTAPQLAYDSAANQTAFFFTTIWSGLGGYHVGDESVTKYYQGAEASNQLLRTVDTISTCSSLVLRPGCPPTSTTTTLENGQQARMETDYGDYGNVMETREFDWGAPGPLLRRTTFTYLTDSNYISRQILNLVTRVVVKDGAGNIKSRTDTQYDSTALICVPTTPTVPQHDDTNYGCGFNFRGNPTAVTQYTDPVTPAGPITATSVYDSLGNLRSVTDPGGHTTSFSYADNYSDAVNRNTYAYLTQTTKPAPFNSQTTGSSYYYFTGQPASGTDENSRVTTFTYADALNRLTQTNYPDGGQISISYNDPARTITTTQKRTATDNIVTAKVYNPLGQMVQSQMPGGRKQDFTYDPLGREWKSSNVYINSSESTYGVVEARYDALERTTTAVNQDQTTVQTQYSGSAVKTTDETGRQRLTDSDGLGHITKACEVTAGNTRSPAESCNLTGFGGTGYLTTNTYNALDQLTQTTQGAQTRTSTFDPLGRLLSARVIEVNTQTDVSYGYNNDGLRTSITDPRGTVSFEYDELHRPKRKRYNGTVVASWSYDGAQSANGIGRLMTENDGDFGSGADHCDYTYDAMGRMLSANRTISTTPYPISYTYDLAGNLTSLGYPSGRLVQYDFTGGQLNKVTDATNAQAPFNYVSSVTYAPLGTLQQVNLGNNVVTTALWNNRVQLASILTQKTAGASYLSLGYSYFTNGQIQQITNNLNANKTEKYTYDDLRRLLTAQLGPDSGMVRKYQYDYDRYANRWGQNLVAGSGYNAQLIFDAASNRVSSGGFSFDASGNLSANATGTPFTYNAESLLTGAGAVSYKVDARELRVRKTNGTAVTDYFYSGSELLAEKAGGQWSDYIFFGDQRIVQQTGSSAATATYLHVDHLGSTRVCTDASGNSNGTCDYEPFGETQVSSTCSVPTSFRYAGMQWDSESNLFHTWFRQYDPTQGRWMSVDPLPGSENASQSMDRYAYVADDPVNGIDPYGLLTGDFLVLQGGWEFIHGQLFNCQIDGISTSCADFANFGFLRKLFEEAAFGVFVGGREGGHYVYDLDLALKLLALQQLPLPFSSRPAPCKGVSASDLQYDVPRPRKGGILETGGEHIFKNHIAGNPLKKSQYRFDLGTTVGARLPAVIGLNAETFYFGTASQARPGANIVISYNVPGYPYTVHLPDGSTGVVVGLGTLPGGILPTTFNTLVLGPDCRYVVTSHPGLP